MTLGKSQDDRLRERMSNEFGGSTDAPGVLRAAVRARGHLGARERAAVRALGRQGVRAALLLLHPALARHRPAALHQAPHAG